MLRHGTPGRAERALVGAGFGLTIVVCLLFLMRRGPAGSRTRRANVYEIGVVAGVVLEARTAGTTAVGVGATLGSG